MFPDARFVHIVRDPYIVYPSTVNLWKSLARGHCLHTPHNKNVEEKVIREFRIIYDRLEEARQLLRPNRFYELHYEQLIADPVGELEKIYTALELDGFANARPRLEDYLKQTKDYETNKYAISAEQRKVIDEEWGDVIRRYGYG